MSARKFLGWRPWWGDEKSMFVHKSRNEALITLGVGVRARCMEHSGAHCRLKKVYAKRSAEEEREDVVAAMKELLSGSLDGTRTAFALGFIEAGRHVGAAKKGSP